MGLTESVVALLTAAIAVLSGVNAKVDDVVVRRNAIELGDQVKIVAANYMFADKIIREAALPTQRFDISVYGDTATSSLRY